MATQPETAQPKRGALIVLTGALLAIVGPVTGKLLLTETPAHESGRKVAVTVSPQARTATIQHISGPQYLKAYLDIVKVPTACDGLTGKDIQIGRHFTEAQCALMLEARLAETAQHVMACTPGLALTIPGRDFVRFAAVSLAYNVGWPTYCRSTMRRNIDAGNLVSACVNLTLFNRAGGRVLKGLVDRRTREMRVCLKDA
ncbi:lysozyme [Novosphingobium humi]|uniref:Lysozyme n=1 Tax=Novosphingobium humi TaxID=2282397 RepID=A0ABY7TTH8_9SPHN|nr:lysozyme [Novosphingobium humi]WCT76296.1 lysozyme [Novosphingobium humi]WJS97241.1 lysozyme [Novosphingobium humi]